MDRCPTPRYCEWSIHSFVLLRWWTKRSIHCHSGGLQPSMEPGSICRWVIANDLIDYHPVCITTAAGSLPIKGAAPSGFWESINSSPTQYLHILMPKSPLASPSEIRDQECTGQQVIGAVGQLSLLSQELHYSTCLLLYIIKPCSITAYCCWPLPEELYPKSSFTPRDWGHSSIIPHTATSVRFITLCCKNVYIIVTTELQ